MRTGKVKGKRSRYLCAQGWDGSALGSGPDVGRSGGVTRVSSDAVGNGSKVFFLVLVLIFI